MKSVFLTSPGRCGTHWLGYLLRYTLNLRKNIKKFPGTFEDYVDRIPLLESRTDSNIYIKHFPLGILKKISDIVNIVAIVRDPRDIIVSASFYISSRSEENYEKCLRNFQETISQKNSEKLLQLFSNNLFHKKWFDSLIEARNSVKHHLIRYEDLIKNTEDVIESLIHNLGLDVSRTLIQEAIEKNSFEKMSEGRPRGE